MVHKIDKTLEKHIDTIENSSVSENKTILKSEFLGLVSYYIKFMPHTTE